MTLIHQTTRKAHSTPAEVPPHVVVRWEQIGLTHILRPEINLAVWRCDVPKAIADWLAVETKANWRDGQRDIDCEVSVDDVTETITSRLSAGDVRAHVGIASLAQEAKRLSNLFAQIAGTTSVRLRLGWVTEQQCPRFHADRVTMRLLCTYHGPATEWLAQDAILESPDAEPPEPLVHRFATGDVVIMKGSLHENAAGALRHRSPRVNPPAEWRLLLSLDPVRRN